MDPWLRRLLLRGSMLVLAGIGMFAWPRVEGWWARTTSTCAKLITPDDLRALGGTKTEIESAYHCEFFCDANYGYSAFVNLDPDKYHSEKQDEKWLADAKEAGATVETLVDGAAWLALDGKTEHALIVKRENGAAKVTLKKSDYSAEQARKLLPLLEGRWGLVDEYFAAE